jgi:PAS domain S-box-containing protein
MPNLKRVLILEDDDCGAKLLECRICAEWPECAVVHVSNKPDYLNALLTDTFDIIFSDYSLPNFSGMEALSIARKENPEIPFLFVSGAITDEVAAQSLAAGAVDYILKDRPARLVPAIYRALEIVETNGRKIEYGTLVNSVDGIVWQAELPSLQFTFVSQQAERVLGYPTGKWVNEPGFWQNHIHPDDREMAINICKKLTPEQSHPDFEYRMIAADGHIVWLRDIVNVLVKKNRPPQIQGIMVDVTHHKSAEEKIKEVQLKLEKTNEDLVRRNQEIQKFYHVLSHELKTP